MRMIVVAANDHPDLDDWVTELAEAEAQRSGLSIVPPTERPSATGGWVQLDDSDYPDWAWTDVSEHVSDAYGLEQRSTVALRIPPDQQHAAAERLVEMVRAGRLDLKPSAKPLPEEAPSVPDQRSWAARLWRWVWFRG